MSRVNRIAIAAWACGLLMCGLHPAASQPSADPSDGGQRLVVDHPHVDLGTVRQGGTYEFSYVLRNEGTADLLITRIRSLCGCTVTEPREEKQLAPGEWLTLSATFDSTDQVGPKTKEILVYSNAPGSPSSLTFSAVVDAIYQLRPNLQRVVFKDLCRGQVLDRTLDLLAGTPGKALEIVALSFTRSGLSYTSEPIVEKGYSGYRLSFVLDPDVPIGSFNTVAHLTVRSDGEQAQFELPFGGEVISNIGVQPRFLVEVAPVLPGDPLTYGRIHLRAVNRDSPFRIRRVHVGPALTCTIDEQQRGLEYIVSLQVAPTAPKGPLGSTLLIFTDSPDQPIIDIPVFANIGSRVTVLPEVVFLRRDRPEDPWAAQVVTLQSDSAGFAVERVSCDHAGLEITELSAVGGQTERKIRLRLADETAAGEFRATVNVVTNVPGAGEVQIPVFAEVADPRPDSAQYRP